MGVRSRSHYACSPDPVAWSESKSQSLGETQGRFLESYPKFVRTTPSRSWLSTGSLISRQLQSRARQQAVFVTNFGYQPLAFRAGARYGVPSAATNPA
jgi:hypothetical protein